MRISLENAGRGSRRGAASFCGARVAGVIITSDGKSGFDCRRWWKIECTVFARLSTAACEERGERS
jgi:hypothetical protein